MPNHVKNIVKMEGITKLPLFKTEYDKYEKKDIAVFDFNKIIPMPESLNIGSGSITDEAIIYYVTDKCTLPLRAIKEEHKKLVDRKVTNIFSKDSWAEEVFMRVLEETHDMPAEEKEQLYEKGQIYVSNIENYGCATWYDWCVNNWGTKWNAYSCTEESEDEITFETAWSNPEPIMLKLSEMYPEATIEHWWADEDMGSNDGYRVYEGGEIVEGDYYDSCSNEAYETYIKCWGESQCLYQDKDGLWQQHDCDTCHGCD